MIDRFVYGQQLRVAAAVCMLAAAGVLAGPARAGDADEAELLKDYDKVDVWHFPVDYTVRYNDTDVVVTRALTPQPPAAGELCYIRFDVVRAEGDYAYGFKPAALGGARKENEWGVVVRKRGNIFNQLYSSLKMNVIYFYVDGPKKDAPGDICSRKRKAPTAQAGQDYKASEWSDLVVRGRLIHGWPGQASR